MTITNRELLEKSLRAAISAIEIYNKPDFRYREENFAILMCAAWELLFKAKALLDNGDNLDVITAYRFDLDQSTGQRIRIPKTTR